MRAIASNHLQSRDNEIRQPHKASSSPLAHLTVLHNALELVEDGLCHVDLFPDHGIVLVVGIIRVPQLHALRRGAFARIRIARSAPSGCEAQNLRNAALLAFESVIVSTHLSVRLDLKLQKLVPELSLVANIVAQVKVVAHPGLHKGGDSGGTTMAGTVDGGTGYCCTFACTSAMQGMRRGAQRSARDPDDGLRACARDLVSAVQGNLESTGMQAGH